MKYEMFVNKCEDGALGGFFIRTCSLVKFMKILRERGFNPVGVIIDDEDSNIVEVVLENNEALVNHLKQAEEFRENNKETNEV